MKLLNKCLILSSLIVSLTGCSWFTTTVVKEVPLEITQPVLPRSLDLKEPHWYVVSEKNLEKFLREIKDQEGTVVFFAMSVEDYELMAYNMQEIKRYIKDLKNVVIYYKKATTNENNGSTEK